MQGKASNVGFDWEHPDQVWDKVREEMGEVEDAIRTKRADDIEAEFGDLLFSIINAARLYGINPENALERTNRKFIRRFNHVESAATAQGKKLKDLTIAEMDTLWEDAKSDER